MLHDLRTKFVSLIYADHNSSRSIRNALKKCIDSLPADGAGLNIGAGGTRVDPRVKNLDIMPGQFIDIVSSAVNIPLPNDSLDLVISQECLEHVAEIDLVVNEINRLLKPGGLLYLQLPFIIGYHPGPHDFLRFSKEGIVQLIAKTDLVVMESEISVGSATGFYRIAVEFLAILFSGPIQVLYIPVKAFASLLLYPLKWLDLWASLSKQNDRIAGGYYLIARKKS